MLLIDGPNFCWRAHSVAPELRSEGRLTGVLHVALMMLARVPILFEPQQVVFLWDDRWSWKRQKFPEYKANRAGGDQTLRSAVYAEIDELRRLLDSIGFPQVQEKGMEADDLAGMMIQVSKKPVLVSSDKDWFQLLRFPGVRLVRGWKGKELNEMDARGLVTKYGVLAKDWVKYQALVGDPGDNIPKVRVGIGPVMARRILAGEFKLLPEERRRWERNIQMATIVTEVAKPPEIRIPRRSEQGWTELENFLMEYELHSLWTERRKVWEVAGWR